MNESWSRVGLILVILCVVGWFTDFSVANLRWVYLPLFAIGTILYVMPKEYYGKNKER